MDTQTLSQIIQSIITVITTLAGIWGLLKNQKTEIKQDMNEAIELRFNRMQLKLDSMQKDTQELKHQRHKGPE